MQLEWCNDIGFCCTKPLLGGPCYSSAAVKGSDLRWLWLYKSDVKQWLSNTEYYSYLLMYHAMTWRHASLSFCAVQLCMQDTPAGTWYKWQSDCSWLSCSYKLLSASTQGKHCKHNDVAVVFLLSVHQAISTNSLTRLQCKPTVTGNPTQVLTPSLGAPSLPCRSDGRMFRYKAAKQQRQECLLQTALTAPSSPATGPGVSPAPNPCLLQHSTSVFRPPVHQSRRRIVLKQHVTNDTDQLASKSDDDEEDTPAAR